MTLAPDTTNLSNWTVRGFRERVREKEEHQVFSGKIDRSKLSFGEKAIMIAVKAPEGDFRDWDAIDSWARRIATELALEVQTQ